MTRLKMPKRKDAVARGAWLEPRPWLRECGAAAGAAAPSGQAADEGGGVGVVQSEAASRPATTVPPQEYMYKNHTCPRSRRTTSLRHLVAEQLVDRPSEEEVELENERMAAPGAWKADADTSGATSPPPSSWVCHAGSGELIKTGCGNPIWSLICCRRRSDRSIQFTLCLQPYASELYFSNSLP